MEPGARALLHANQPSLRLPAALPPSSRPPSSALPPPACGAPSFPAGPQPPPPPASCSLAFPRVLPAAGKWNPATATATASLAGRPARPAPRSPPRAPSAGPDGERAAGSAPGAQHDRGPEAEGPRSRLQASEERPGNLHSRAHLLCAGGLHAMGSDRHPKRTRERRETARGVRGSGPERQGRPLDRRPMPPPSPSALPPRRPQPAQGQSLPRSSPCPPGPLPTRP